MKCYFWAVVVAMLLVELLRLKAEV